MSPLSRIRPAFQAVLFATRKGNCPRPCDIDLTSACLPSADDLDTCGPADQRCQTAINYILGGGLTERVSPPPTLCSVVCLLFLSSLQSELRNSHRSRPHTLHTAADPEWYAGSGLVAGSDPRVAQAFLHSLGAQNGAGCMLPCGDLSALHLGFDPGAGSPHPLPTLAPATDPVGRCNERVRGTFCSRCFSSAPECLPLPLPRSPPPDTCPRPRPR